MNAEGRGYGQNNPRLSAEICGKIYRAFPIAAAIPCGFLLTSVGSFADASQAPATSVMVTDTKPTPPPKTQVKKRRWGLTLNGQNSRLHEAKPTPQRPLPHLEGRHPYAERLRLLTEKDAHSDSTLESVDRWGPMGLFLGLLGVSRLRRIGGKGIFSSSGQLSRMCYRTSVGYRSLAR